jgi:hypothetical protein
MDPSTIPSAELIAGIHDLKDFSRDPIMEY